MKSLLTLVFSAALLVTTTVSSEDRVKLCDGFLPENRMQIPVQKGDFSIQSTQMTQSEYNSVIDSVQNIYQPIFSSLGMSLVILRLWTNNNVNSQAYQQNGSSVVEIWGGLARHQAITDDGLALIVCHEIGHHLGGAPKFSGAGNTWASVEGEADYFSTMKCLRKVFAAQGTPNGSVDPVAQQKCDDHWGSGSKNAKICGRIADASQSAANLNYQLLHDSNPDTSTIDPRVANVTDESHPGSQCRLDTYDQGARCLVSDSVPFSNTDANVGACVNSAAQSYGARPLCWFKPGPLPSPTPTPTPSPTPTPTPTPPPVGGVAKTPLLNGAVALRSNNPYMPIHIHFDVSNFSTAAGFYFEISAANKNFSDPNGQAADPQDSVIRYSYRARTMDITILPVQQLPSWGVYQVRVIPLDGSGRVPQGYFSNSATLNLAP